MDLKRPWRFKSSHLHQVYFIFFARVAEWYTRMFKEHVPQGVQVQLLSRAHIILGRLAQLVRASRLHREGRGFESLSDH